jgi:hypothetical protein
MDWSPRGYRKQHDPELCHYACISWCLCSVGTDVSNTMRSSSVSWNWTFLPPWSLETEIFIASVSYPVAPIRARLGCLQIHHEPTKQGLASKPMHVRGSTCWRHVVTFVASLPSIRNGRSCSTVFLRQSLKWGWLLGQMLKYSDAEKNSMSALLKSLLSSHPSLWRLLH